MLGKYKMFFISNPYFLLLLLDCYSFSAFNNDFFIDKNGIKLTIKLGRQQNLTTILQQYS